VKSQIKSGGFFGWVGMKGVKKLIQLAKKLNEEAKENEKSFTKSLPLPEPIKHHFVVSILVFVAAWVYTHAGRPLPAPIRQSFTKLFPPEKKTWNKFFQEGLEKAFNMVLKNYVLFAVLLFLFVFRKKLLQVFFPQQGDNVFQVISGMAKMTLDNATQAWNKTIAMALDMNRSLSVSNQALQQQQQQNINQIKHDNKVLVAKANQQTEIAHQFEVNLTTSNTKLEVCNSKVNTFKRNTLVLEKRANLFQFTTQFLIEKMKSFSSGSSGINYLELIDLMNQEAAKNGYPSINHEELYKIYLPNPEIADTSANQFLPQPVNATEIRISSE
jgi:hypothetical protein